MESNLQLIVEIPNDKKFLTAENIKGEKILDNGSKKEWDFWQQKVVYHFSQWRKDIGSVNIKDEKSVLKPGLYYIDLGDAMYLGRYSNPEIDTFKVPELQPVPSNTNIK